MYAKLFFFSAMLHFIPSYAVAAIVGTNPPSMPLTMERIDALPADLRPAWREYLNRSERQLAVDQTVFYAELKKDKIKRPLVPPESGSANSIPLSQPNAWYGQQEAQRIADIVISFQTPAGGWSKNLDMSRHQRRPGEFFAGGNLSSYLTPLDNDRPRHTNWNYVGTFDNDATVTQLRYLAKVIATHAAAHEAQYRTCFERGMNYIFAAQYPNGGLPQVWPLQGGYHDAITYNDDAMLNVLEFLKEVAEGTGDFAFTSAKTRSAAAESLHRGLACLLATQITVDGHRTVWCQQHDPLTLLPASARNYEMPAQCGSESATILMFLMRLPDPDEKTVAAVHAAAVWFKKNEIRDVAFTKVGGQDREVVPKPGAGPIWARYYEVGSDRPLFGDRDKTIHDNVREISQERRNGYSWYSHKPQRALDQYAVWSKDHPKAKTE